MSPTDIWPINGWLNNTSYEFLTSVAIVLGVSTPSQNVVAI